MMDNQDTYMTRIVLVELSSFTTPVQDSDPPRNLGRVKSRLEKSRARREAHFYGDTFPSRATIPFYKLET
jgi:hypothetical protein